MHDVERNTSAVEKSRPGSVGRRLLVFIIYLVFGPPIGGFLVINGFVISMGVNMGGAELISKLNVQSFFDVLMWPFWSMVLSLFGYLFGGIQAAITGLVLVLMSDERGHFSYRTAIIATLPSSLLTAIFLATEGDSQWLFIAILALVSIAASVLVRYFFRKRFEPAKI